jgi:hypothetical protein
MRLSSFAVRKLRILTTFRRTANAPRVKILVHAVHAVQRILLVETSFEAAGKLGAELDTCSISEEVVYSSPYFPFNKIRPKK